MTVGDMKGVFFAIGLAIASPSVSALQITHVAAAPAVINTANDDEAVITFALSEPADTVLEIYDARGRVVHTQERKVLEGGDQQFTWDGTTTRGEPVVPEAYTYVITATATDGKAVTYNPTPLTRNEPVQSDDIDYVPDAGELRYVLPGPSRIFLRLGIKNGPLLATVVNGAVRPGGLNTERWDGWDQSGVINLANHPRLLFGIRGHQLPVNTILVKNGETFPAQPDWPEDADSDAGQAAQWPSARSAGRCATPEHCRDFKVALEVLDIKRNPVADDAVDPDQPVVFRVRLNADDGLELESQRFEVSFYADNQLIYENESSYMPYSWTLEPGKLGAGEHYLTALVIGFGGHFGVASTRLNVSN